MKDCWFFLKLFKPHRVWLVGGISLSLLTALAAVDAVGLVYQLFRDSGNGRY